MSQFRVEFRYPGGTRHYRYFDTLEESVGATDTMKQYPFGALQPAISYPSSKQLQKKGPRGGWSKVTA